MCTYTKALILYAYAYICKTMRNLTSAHMSNRLPITSFNCAFSTISRYVISFANVREFKLRNEAVFFSVCEFQYYLYLCITLWSIHTWQFFPFLKTVQFYEWIDRLRLNHKLNFCSMVKINFKSWTDIKRKIILVACATWAWAARVSENKAIVRRAI